MTTESHSPPTAPATAASATGPQLRDHELAGRDDEVIRLRGRLLGFASSESDHHQHHDPDGYPRPGERCSACRWFECRIFEVQAVLSPDHQPAAPDGRYLVLTYGLSEVPGEVDKRRAVWVTSPHEIIELLTQRGRSDRQAFLPAASARALAQAAHWSPEVNEAYVNRAVV